jgi:very-short-patch-repair endonuclease
MAKSHLEEQFVEILTTQSALTGIDIPEPACEFRFDARRKWRFDFAWPAQQVAVEIDGATWAHGRHVRGSGFASDCDKCNTATSMGWRVLRFTETNLSDPRAVFGIVVQTLDLFTECHR